MPADWAWMYSANRISTLNEAAIVVNNVYGVNTSKRMLAFRPQYRIPFGKAIARLIKSPQVHASTLRKRILEFQDVGVLKTLDEEILRERRNPRKRASRSGIY